MVEKSDIRWFKETFWDDVVEAVQGTVFDADMLMAIACQETGELWSAMRRKGLPKDEIVRLCCGDTLDAPNRRAFPKNKAALVAHPRGEEMFAIARAALLAMAEHVPGYQFAFRKPDKFCHGYGVFQYDLQFFKEEPDYFLEKRYEVFAETLARALRELTTALKKRRLHEISRITDFEFCTVAITYNTGGYRPSKGLKQGHFDGSRYYGEYINDYVSILRGLAPPERGEAADIAERGSAVIALWDEATAKGPHMRVETLSTTLRLRSAPQISKPPSKNVVAELPDGWTVRAVDNEPTKGFFEVEAVLNGRVFRGFASEKYLVSLRGAAEPPEAAPVATQFPAVWMPRRSGHVTKRTATAGAHSLNEPDMPGRSGRTPAELREELAAIIKYLNPEKASHKRYQPGRGLTFCNIYAHDYCALAGVFLPRVWWTDPALLSIGAGDVPKPQYGQTIREMRANDLFRWLRDFGPQHGWVRSVSATELQNQANLGAACLVIARRRVEGRSGHLAMVVPETGEHQAKRLADGEVTSPLQSQAGSRNFNYGHGASRWWTGDRFAESAFWSHS